MSDDERERLKAVLAAHPAEKNDFEEAKKYLDEAIDEILFD